MEIYFKKDFIKRFKKLPQKTRRKFDERITLFKQDTQANVLHNHALHGIYMGCRSIDITGDIRAIYKIQSRNIALFIDIDNHSNLYK